MFRVVRVDSRSAVALEPLGTKRKFWFRDEANRRMLFKAEERGTGEDWAEKIACELCGLLGLPHVLYDLAVESAGEKPGVVCETCAPPPMALVLGHQLMLARDPNYPAEEGRKYKVREHTVQAVADVVRGLRPPPTQWLAGLPEGITSALDAFVGYIMLDAWVANQDRHHENWGALREGDSLHLAPTFDHGASMARNLTDEERKERLTTRDERHRIQHFVRRAKSAFYADARAKKPMPTVEAWQAFSRQSPKASMIWVDRLRAIEDNTLRMLVAMVPPNRLSSIGRDFTLQLLIENRQRILDGDDA